jgi:hypothetical protein
MHSPIQKSTMLTPMSDAAFDSDKPDLIEGYEGSNTCAKRPSNSMFGEVIPAGASAPELHSIDLRLLLRKQVLGEDTSPSACQILPPYPNKTYLPGILGPKVCGKVWKYLPIQLLQFQTIQALQVRRKATLQGVLRRDTRTRPTWTRNVQQKQLQYR